METPPPMVDIHCHVLPELDDGAATWDEALAMARLAAADGIATVIATPHQLGCYADNRARQILAQVNRLQGLLDEQGVRLRVLPGGDVRVEPEIIAKVRSGDVLTLADRGRHVLVELPHEVCLPLERLLADLSTAGLTAILSHPERNAALMAQAGAVRSLIEAGCLIQITGASLTGTFGVRARGAAESLVQQGLVHFVASDAHSPRARPPILSRAFERVVALAGRELAVEVCCTNPAGVVAGAAIMPGVRRTAKPSWSRWLPWRRAG